MAVQKAVADRLTTVQKTKVSFTMMVMVVETTVAAATAVAEESPIRVVDVNTRRSDTYSRKQHSVSGLPEKLEGLVCKRRRGERNQSTFME